MARAGATHDDVRARHAWRSQTSLQMMTTETAPINATDVASSAPRDLCPEPAFRASLAAVAEHLPGGLEQAGGTENIVSSYLALPAHESCVAAPRPPQWPASKLRVGPILNVGEGTTGTRFVSCVFSELGFRCAALAFLRLARAAPHPLPSPLH